MEASLDKLDNRLDMMRISELLQRCETAVANIERAQGVTSSTPSASEGLTDTLSRLEGVVARLADGSLQSRPVVTTVAPAAAPRLAPAPSPAPRAATASVSAPAASEDAIARAIRLLTSNDATVTELSLNFSAIDAVAASSLAKALETNDKLQSLSMVACGLSDHAAVALAAALEKNKTLTLLNVESNRIAKAGYLAFARAIATNSTLITFKLANQAVAPGEEEQTALAAAVEVNTALTKLALDFTSPTPRNKMEQAITRNAFNARSRRPPAAEPTGPMKKVAMSTALSLEERVKPASTAFAAWNSRQNASHLFFVLGADAMVTPQREGGDNATWDEFLAELPPAAPIWATCHFRFETKEGGKRSKTVFVAWVPNEAPLRERMRYAEITAALRHGMSGVHAMLQADCLADLGFEAIKNKVGAFEVDGV